jgi:hypothetical protein
MSLPWIERRYGFGAGRVPLRPVQRRRRDLRSIREGWAEAVRDGDTPGSSVVGILRASPAFAAIAVALTFLFATVLTLPPDESEISIVAFAEPPIEKRLPDPPPPEVPVVPEELPPPPEPEPAPVERAKPEPSPPRPDPVRVAPPPPPMQIQQVARAQEPPRPAAPRRVTRDTRAQPERAPRLSFDPLAAPDPEPPPPERPTRAPRFAAARPPDAMPRLDAPALRATPAAPAPSLRSERSKPAPDRSRRATAQLALAASAPALPSDRRPTQRESRRAPALPAPRRSSRSQVALDVPDSGSSTPKRPPPPPPPPAPAARPRSDEPGLRGVPLGSLAACVSDRLEDSLKQKVVAAVRDRTHCESPTGRYHFVETKNVNAFLMGIERAKRRKPGDRCAELTHALACLSPRKR